MWRLLLYSKLMENMSKSRPEESQALLTLPDTWATASMHVRFPGLYRLDLTCTNITPAPHPPGSGHIVQGCIVWGTKNTWDKKFQTHRNVTVLGLLLEILHFRCFFKAILYLIL